MSLRKLLTWLVTGFGVMLLVCISLLAQLFLFPQYKEAELKLMETNMDRIEAMLGDKLSSLVDMGLSWSVWDAAYEFVQGNNPEFIEVEMSEEALAAAGLNFMAYLNETGEIVGIQTSEMEANELSELKQTLMDKKEMFWFESASESRRGLLLRDGIIWMMAAAPVVKSDAGGEVKGTIVVGVVLSDEVLESMRSGWQYNFFVEPVAKSKLTKDQQNKMLAGQTVSMEISVNERVGYRIMEDYFGEKVFEIELTRDREIFQSGLQSLKNYGLVLGGLVVMAIGATLFLSQKFFGQPLMVLMQELRQIQQEHRYGSRLSIQGILELRQLEETINQVFEVNERLGKSAAESTRIARARVEEMEQGFRDLEKTKAAMINVMEDQQELEEQLKQEKEAVEKRVVERTKQLAEEQAKLKGSIENLPGGFLLVDKSGEVAMMNAALEKIAGGVAKEGVVELIRVWLKEHGVEGSGEEQEQLLPNEPVSVSEVEHNGAFLSLSVVPIEIETGAEKERVGWVVLVIDVTQAKMLERSRNEFFSIASHELRTPLTAIRGNAAMIRDYFPEAMKDEALAQSVSDIHSGAVRLIQIVNDFLDASRLELGKIKFEIGEVEVVTIVKKVMEAMKATAEEKKIGWRLELGGIEEVKVTADKARVEQVLYNLIGNAQKFTKEGEVVVETAKEGSWLVVRVTDTGSGIPTENHQLLFKKFQQAGESVYTRDVSQGSGMGLYISRLLARGMGGDIALESSELGKGSVFVFRLPLLG